MMTVARSEPSIFSSDLVFVAVESSLAITQSALSIVPLGSTIRTICEASRALSGSHQRLLQGSFGSSRDSRWARLVHEGAMTLEARLMHAEARRVRHHCCP